MSAEEYTGTIKFSWIQYPYEVGASATVNFSADQLPDGITVEYSDDYFLSEILPLILKDVEAYMEDPKKWVKDYINRGPATWAKQRQLEMDIDEYKGEIANLESGIAWRKERLAEKETLLSDLKASLEKKDGEQ